MTGDYDDPKIIIEKTKLAQNKLVYGFFANDNANRKKLEESKKSNNYAILLDVKTNDSS